MDNKKLNELTEAEIEQRSKITPDEQVAIDVFMAAAAALPDTLCVEIDDSRFHEDEISEPNLIVRKRVTLGFAIPVAKLCKPSLSF